MVSFLVSAICDFINRLSYEPTKLVSSHYTIIQKTPRLFKPGRNVDRFRITADRRAPVGTCSHAYGSIRAVEAKILIERFVLAASGENQPPKRSQAFRSNQLQKAERTHSSGARCVGL